jgi:hypothetical protein
MPGKGGAKQAAEKPLQAVIPSGAKDLALSFFQTMRDSSSPAAPQNDSANEFFRSLESPALRLSRLKTAEPVKKSRLNTFQTDSFPPRLKAPETKWGSTR